MKEIKNIYKFLKIFCPATYFFVLMFFGKLSTMFNKNIQGLLLQRKNIEFLLCGISYFMSDWNPYSNHFPIQASLTAQGEILSHVAYTGPAATSVGMTLPATGSSTSSVRLLLRYVCTVVIVSIYMNPTYRLSLFLKTPLPN